MGEAAGSAQPPATSTLVDSELADPEPVAARPSRQRPTGRVDHRAVRLVVHLYWLWPGLLMLAAGAWRLGRPALWADELATWGAVRLSWDEMFRLLNNVDAVLAPYYVLEKAWSALVGTSTVALRLPSLLAMSAAAALTAVLGARLAGGPPTETARSADGSRPASTAPGRPAARHEPARPVPPAGPGSPAARWAGFLAGLAFAIVPVTSRYGQEARPYALELAFAVLATLLLVRLLDRPRAGRAASYGLAVALTGAMHLVGLLLLVAHLAAVLARRDRSRLLRHWLPAAVAALMVLAPLAWWGRTQPGQLSWIPWAHWRTLLGTPSTLFGTGLVGGAFVVLAVLALVWPVERRTPPGPTRLPAAKPLDTAAQPDGPAGSGHGPAANPRVLLAAWAVLPVLALFLAGRAAPLFWPRYLIFTAPAYLLLSAPWLAGMGAAGHVPARAELAGVGPAGVGPAGTGAAGHERPSRWPTWTGALVVLAAIALLALPRQAAIRGPAGHNHATAQAAGIIATHERPGDAIAYALHEPTVPWEGRDVVARYVPADRRPDDVFALTGQREHGHLLATECPDLAACLDRRAPRRIWLLRFEHATDPLTGLGQPKEALLRARYKIAKTWPVRGLTVALLTHR